MKAEPAVKSLAAVPQVLEIMEQKIDWTQKLGDAFLAQQVEVMKAVQRLRAKASAAGHLESGKEQTVTSTQEGGDAVILIEPVNPEVIYVPTYDPTVVHGGRPYPAYPPYYWYPPGLLLPRWGVPRRRRHHRVVALGRLQLGWRRGAYRHLGPGTAQAVAKMTRFDSRAGVDEGGLRAGAP